VLLCLYGVGVDAVPGAAIVGVWLYCLLWVFVTEIVKMIYWRLAGRRDKHLTASRVALAG
jgi:H+-transporting ATPase